MSYKFLAVKTLCKKELSSFSLKQRNKQTNKQSDKVRLSHTLNIINFILFQEI